MKKRFLMISTIILTGLLTVGGVFAQDGDKKMKMDGDMSAMMEKMHKSPHHKMMMTYRENVLNFAKTLRDMAVGGKIEDVELARNAFAEIKRGMEKMEEIHQAHSGKMSAEMREKMKPMMEKMQAEKAAMKEHIVALEKTLQTDAPDAKEVEKHAAAIVGQMEKKMDMKMDMSDKMKNV
jgi:hypothetical protein